MQKSEEAKKTIDRRESGEAWGEVLVDWDIGGRILEEEADGRHEMGNRGLGGETQSHKDVGESRLAGTQYNLNQGNGRYSSARTKKIIAHEMLGMRKEIQKEDTNKCYGVAARRVETNAPGEHVPFVRVLKKDAPKDEGRTNERFSYAIKH